MTRFESDFVAAGYRWVMSQDEGKRDELRARMLQQYARLDDFLVRHSTSPAFLFDTFGWAECVFTPFFMRFWLLEYYEDFALPPEPRYERVRRWIDACIAHAAAQQVTREEIVKSYYDYAQGAGNGALPPGRHVSSFSFEPSWHERPWPPREKYVPGATDAGLGLISRAASRT